MSTREQRRNKEKIFNDPIHGHIEVNEVCVSIIDTVQFQRLRQIKQLGGVYYVFPGAAHNRFEHSIGVSHLAGKFVRTLRERQPELHIDEKDILCVEIAGLCHDLGHGPFSHMFEKFVEESGDKDWKHEQASVQMFDHLVKENKLKETLFQENKLEDEDITFIKELFYGPLKEDGEYRGGRPKEKHFLYEIVNNRRNGIDVDKWDYFARDCHMLGISNSFDHNRLIKFARVVKVDGEYQICIRDQEVRNVYDMFHTRDRLHRGAYKHKVAMIIERMIIDALVSANDQVSAKNGHFTITGTNCKMSETVKDMTAYTKMTDNILYEILNTTDECLEKSRQIIRNVLERKIYKCIGYITEDIDKDTLRKEVAEESGLHVDDLVVLPAKFNYAKQEENPIDSVRFYSKHDETKAKRIDKDIVSKMLPGIFSEKHIRVYCKKRDNESMAAAWKGFEKWCKNHRYKPMKGNAVTDFEESPLDSQA